MYSGGSVLYGHSQKNILLILLSLAFVPLDTFIVICSLLSNYVIRSRASQRRDAARRDPAFQPRTILVTGVGMSKGLCLARLFYEAGHDVIGADFSSNACGRVSRSLLKFYTLQKPDAKLGSVPYIQGLLDIVLREEVDLWVSCSGVASAVEDGEAKEIIEARTSCKAIQFDVATTQVLHDKDTFIAHTEEIGLDVPETHTVTNRAAAATALRDAPEGRMFIMKPIGTDDANRGDMTLLPKDTNADTIAHLAKLKISEKSPWIVQQFIKGPEYCTHSLVVKGEVRAFVACPSAELLMHYEALPTSSKLGQAMLRFTEEYAAKGGENFTGHLSFDFMIDESQVDSQHRVRNKEPPTLYPIECNPRAHTAVVLFNGTPGLPAAYLSLLDNAPVPKTNGYTNGPTESIVAPQRSDKYFWIGHDAVELIVLPLLSLLLFQPDASITFLLETFIHFTEHLLVWYDGTFERWDPAPWWWLYHVYWPLQFWNALKTGKSWSRINVSTTKVFES